jgi:hypothetical protein
MMVITRELISFLAIVDLSRAEHQPLKWVGPLSTKTGVQKRKGRLERPTSGFQSTIVCVARV